ncbi:hypothetical protein ABZP36_021709, partial [Zizania latifolia]
AAPRKSLLSSSRSPSSSLSPLSPPRPLLISATTLVSSAAYAELRRRRLAACVTSSLSVSAHTCTRPRIAAVAVVASPMVGKKGGSSGSDSALMVSHSVGLKILSRMENGAKDQKLNSFLADVFCEP